MKNLFFLYPKQKLGDGTMALTVTSVYFSLIGILSTYYSFIKNNPQIAIEMLFFVAIVTVAVGFVLWLFLRVYMYNLKSEGKKYILTIINMYITLIGILCTLYSLVEELLRPLTEMKVLLVLTIIFLGLLLWYGCERISAKYIKMPEWEKCKTTAQYFARQGKYLKNKFDYKKSLRMYQRASDTYKAAIDSFPETNYDLKQLAELYIYRGGVLKNCKEYNKAIESIEKGLTLTEKMDLKADAYYNLACVYAAKNDRRLFEEYLGNIGELEDYFLIMTQKAKLSKWLKDNECKGYIVDKY